MIANHYEIAKGAYILSSDCDKPINDIVSEKPANGWPVVTDGAVYAGLNSFWFAEMPPKSPFCTVEG